MRSCPRRQTPTATADPDPSDVARRPILAGRTQIRQQARREAILDVAQHSFFELGFGGTSMSAIAARCGGSKSTLWKFFPTKEVLFKAFVGRLVGNFGEALDETLIPGGELAPSLARFGTIYLTKILSDESQALSWLLSSEAKRVPELAVAFYEQGPKRVRERLAAFLAEEMASGRLRNGEPMLAARQFLALCQAGVFADRMWDRERAKLSDVRGDAIAASDAFLRAWR